MSTPTMRTVFRRSRNFDFSGGIVGGISDYERLPKYVRLADNLVFRPARAMRVRNGYKDVSAANVPLRPNSLAKWYNPNGTNKVFVAGDDQVSAGKLYEMTASAYIEQALKLFDDSAYSPALGKWVFTQINGVLIGAHQATASGKPPFFFGTQNAANTWYSCDFPKPADNLLTLGIAAGGSVDTGAHYYRLRWRFTNGTSASSAGQLATTTPGNNTVNVTTIPLGSLATRPDYLGWTLERTKIGGAAAGPYYFVADGTANAYTDTFADADLLYKIDVGLHGQCPHFEGVIAHKNRLVGWIGSTLWVSQAVADAEASGIFNFDALNQFTVSKDDGDVIVTVVPQSDRLLVLKHRSVHAFEGDDPTSFRVVQVYDGAGCSGPRAAVGFGDTAFFYSGSGGLFRVDGNGVRPFGWTEVGHYKDGADVNQSANVVLANYLGEYLVVAYAATPSAYNEDCLVYDLRFRNWTHWRAVRIAEALTQRDTTDFGGMAILFADPKPVPITNLIFTGTNRTLLVRSSSAPGVGDFFYVRSCTTNIVNNTVLCATVTANDVNFPVREYDANWNEVNTTIPAGCKVGAVTPGVSFTLVDGVGAPVIPLQAATKNLVLGYPVILDQGTYSLLDVASALQDKIAVAYGTLVAGPGPNYRLGFTYGYHIRGGLNSSLGALFITSGVARSFTVSIPERNYPNATEFAEALRFAIQTMIDASDLNPKPTITITYAANKFTLALSTGIIGASTPSTSVNDMWRVMGFRTGTTIGTGTSSMTSDYTTFADRFSWSGPLNATMRWSSASSTCATTLGWDAVDDVGPGASADHAISTAYHVWGGLTGFKDEVAYDGSAGVPINAFFETPLIDEGVPESYKDYERMEVYVAQTTATLTASMFCEPDNVNATIPFTAVSSGAKWNHFIWRLTGSPLATKWGGASGRQVVVAGVPNGTFGRRYKLRLTVPLTTDFICYGYALDMRVLPERRYS